MEWRRGNLGNISKHFSAKEAECSEGICSKQIFDDLLISLLEEARLELGHPIKINSGYRCALKQAQLRKQGYETAKGISSHELGQAADITCAPEHRAELQLILSRLFMNYSIGTARTWWHVDVRSGGPRRWSYK